MKQNRHHELQGFRFDLPLCLTGREVEPTHWAQSGAKLGELKKQPTDTETKAGDPTGANRTAPEIAPGGLAAELASLIRRGVTADALRSTCPNLLSLSIVAAKSASQSKADLGVGASILIQEACVSVDQSKNGPASVLLALAPGTRGSLLKDRRRQAAELLSISPEHFRKDREELLLEAVADEIYAIDSAYRLRHKHRAAGERPPERSALGIDWLEQHRSYRRIWTPIKAMRNDVRVLVEYIETDHEDQADIADRLCTISWWFARFSTELERFIEDQGGLWLLSDPEAEIQAANAISRLDANVPLGEMDSSWLRHLLTQADNHELEPFTDLLIEAGERRRELMGCWMRWASECDCRDGGEPRCERHKWEKAAVEFIRLVDEDWYRVAAIVRPSDTL